MLRTLDASAIIHAWDVYPHAQFPPVWRWVASQIASGFLSIPQPAFGEVERRSPDCASWLRTQKIQRLPVTNEIVHQAVRIKQLLNIDGDNYHPKGVGENDLLIVSTAKAEALILVSNEGRQTQFPKVAAKAKIPTVCDLSDVDVECMDFLALLKQSGEVFEGPGT